MSESQNIQEALATQFGLVYKALYFVEYKDPNYPCKCQCHTNPFMMHCAPCCYNQSYQMVLRYSGVFKTPHSGKNYFLFTDPDPLHYEYPAFPPKHLSPQDEAVMDVQHSHVLHKEVFWCVLHQYTITPHRRSWDKLPKNRHEPVDLPIDFSKINDADHINK